MDQRDAMSFSGSSPFYVRRELAGSGTQSHLHESTSVRALFNSDIQYQSTSNIVGSPFQSAGHEESSRITSPGVNVVSPSGVVSVEPVRKKRGRPRKYGPDSSPSLSPSFSSVSPAGVLSSTQKHGRGRQQGTDRKQHLASPCEWMSDSAGVGFTPHIITVAVGEDVAAKIMSLSQEGPRAVCILSASGAVSTVTLCQSSNSSAFVKYEGRYEILCLSGTYVPTHKSDSCNRLGGLGISLASPDGRVFGGRVGETLIAASSVQVVVGSFLIDGSKKGKAQVAAVEDADGKNDYKVAPPIIQPDQILGPTSSMGAWLSSRPRDIQNSPFDIDLMRD